MAKQVIRDGKLITKKKGPSLSEAVIGDFKQGLGDAADTLTRLPNRVAGWMGLGQAYTKVNPKNKGEMAAQDLWRRTKSAVKAFKKKPKK